MTRNNVKRIICNIESSVAQFISNPTTEMHTLRRYMELYEYCVDVQTNLVDMAAFKKALYSAIKGTICSDVAKWTTEYVCKLSMFFDKSHLLFDIVGRDLCEKEAALIVASQIYATASCSIYSKFCW